MNSIANIAPFAHIRPITLSLTSQFNRRRLPGACASKPIAPLLLKALAAATAFGLALLVAGCGRKTPPNPNVYEVNHLNQFGIVDLAGGTFQQIGNVLPEGASGMVPGPNGTLLTLAFSGNLYSIDVSTGVATVVGPTGLADCTLETSPCGPTSANTIGIVGSTVYVTDVANNLYSANPKTGKATLIGATGIPAVLSVPPGSTNKDGTFNALEAALFTANGVLYATSDWALIDFAAGTEIALTPPTLYRIDTTTGKATMIAPTSLNLTAVTNVNGSVYAYNAWTNQYDTLSLSTGALTKVSDDANLAGSPIYGISKVH